jgi:hypothetical protein
MTPFEMVASERWQPITADIDGTGSSQARQTVFSPDAALVYFSSQQTRTEKQFGPWIQEISGRA